VDHGPSATPNTLPCHGQVRQPPVSSLSDSGPDMWLHRPASTCTMPPVRTATTGTSPSCRRTGLPSGASATESSISVASTNVDQAAYRGQDH
jgi:hypothetical protein